MSAWQVEMRRRRCLLAAALLLLAGALQAAQAQDSVVFDGERYVRVHAERQLPGDRMAQFVPEGETLENWTRSIAIYRYTTLGNDPTRAALELRDSVKAANPDAQARLLVHSVTRDAMLDFLTWPPDGSYLEFNVMRYASDAGGKGLVALRFVYRFRDARRELSKEFNEKRASWKSQVLEFDMGKLAAVLAD
jgi:hypothetical protein